MKSFQLLVVLQAPSANCAGFLIGLIQNNVLGAPELHRQQSWPFDPSVSARRAPEFIALHGDKSEKLIERIGLGNDGRQNERREQQAIRDLMYEQQQRQFSQSQQYGIPPNLQFPVQYTRQNFHARSRIKTQIYRSYIYIDLLVLIFKLSIVSTRWLRALPTMLKFKEFRKLFLEDITLFDSTIIRTQID